MKNFSTINFSGRRVPRLPFLKIKEAVLGKQYDLSLAFVTKAQSKKVNSEMRNKKHPTNVLSFELEKNAGEILICPEIANMEKDKFSTSYSKFIGHLFIHGLFHLKGLAHGSKMERAELEVRKKFDLK